MVSVPKKVHAVYSQVKGEILSGRWETGAKLPKEADLARKFGCSLGTVAKALAVLVHEGLVERRARAGTTVTYGKGGPAGNLLDAYAFIYPSDQHEGVWRTVKGFQDAATQAGRRVVMLSAGSDYLREMEMIARLSEFDVRGAVLFPVIQTPEDQVVLSRLLVESRCPIVLAGVYLPGLGRLAVTADGFHAGYTMTRHMLSRGAGRVGFFSNYAWAPFMRDRYQGYRWALEEAGIPESADIVYLDPVMTPNFEDPLAESRTMARTYLERVHGKVDAIVCADDFLAAGCIEAAEERGWKVPRDLLVSGIDDYSTLPQVSRVELTTYHIPFEEMGSRAFRVLDSLLGKDAGSASEVQLRGELVVRQSA